MGRYGRCKGAEILEFTLVLLPMLAMILVLMDTAWAIYVESSLQYASGSACAPASP